MDDLLDTEIENWIPISIDDNFDEGWEYCGRQLALDVYTNEGPTPHFHFKKNYNNSNEEEGCLTILSANYFIHGTKTATLNNRQLKAIIKFLNSKYKNYERFWDYIIEIWN